MAFFLCSLFFLISSARACDRCVHQTKIAYFSKSDALSCKNWGLWYSSLAIGFNGGRLAASVPSLYKNGAGCGACFQIRCQNKTLCNRQGTKVIITSLNQDNQTDFLLSSRAFRAMAYKGMEQGILKLGFVDAEYKRIPCDYKNQNLAVLVEEFEPRQKTNYLAVKFLFQGGQTEIVAVDVAKVGSPNWTFMTRKYGAVWDTDTAPVGPLQFRMLVIYGYDGKWIWAKNVLPADWKVGVVYDSGVQISDIAQESCSNCDDGSWN